jgi:transglutaminase-like putative cysteine protease
MSIAWQIPRNCLAWLLLSQVTVIAPHLQRLPLWVLLVYLLCAYWRVMVFQGRWSFPNALVKVALIPPCIIGIYFSYGSLLGLEPAVAVLISGFSLKLLEVIKRRDVYVIIFLAYLVVLTEFIFSQDFYITLYLLLPLLTITASLVALHQHSYHGFHSASLKKAAVILLQAVPMMLVLFFVFPRFEPLWSVSLPSHQAKTGVSDHFSPGDISSLSQNGDLAFRVSFTGDIHPQSLLYRRGVVMSKFDGRGWSPGLPEGVVQRAAKPASLFVDAITYDVIQEPSYQNFLFTLPVASALESQIINTVDYRLERQLPIYERIAYRVTSDTGLPMDLELDDRLLAFNIELPATGNPRARQLAQELLSQSRDERHYIDRVISKFDREDFIYTLKPPLLGANSVDEFLFDTRRGFCGHYASSFVFLMRAAGIPARVVAGYMGGEINPITRTVLVHQFDAHAWTEVWLAGEGWVRVDPTAVVSPDRIEQGLAQALAEEGTFLSGSLFSAVRYRQLNGLRMRVDAFNYYWASWVLNYRGEKQLQVLKTLLGEVTPTRLIVLMLSTGVLVTVLVLLFLFRGRTRVKQTPAARIYLAMCKRLEKAGFVRHIAEGPIDFCRRVADQQPEWKPYLLSATRAYVAIAYESHPAEQRRVLLGSLRSEAAKVP